MSEPPHIDLRAILVAVFATQVVGLLGVALVAVTAAEVEATTLLAAIAALTGPVILGLLALIAKAGELRLKQQDKKLDDIEKAVNGDMERRLRLIAREEISRSER